MVWINDSIAFSMAGGFGIQMLSLLELYKTPKEHRPDFCDWTYYVPWIVNIFFAWLIGNAYFGQHPASSTILAIHIGASAPLTFRVLTSSIPKSVQRDLDNH